MGGGSDIAIETAAITLMRHSLHGVADAVAISKGTLRNMKQNLLGAFIYNTLGILIAAGAVPVHRHTAEPGGGRGGHGAVIHYRSQ